MLIHSHARLLLSTLLLAFSVSLIEAKPSERQNVLQLCVREFGTAVDVKQNLFTVNDAFVLQLIFDRHNRLTELAVKPKYFFNETHPAWEEPRSFPLLTVADFNALVARLDSLKSKGRLVKAAMIGMSVITNNTGYYQDQYQRAVLKWGEVGTRENSYSGIRFFSVRFY